MAKPSLNEDALGMMETANEASLGTALLSNPQADMEGKQRPQSRRGPSDVHLAWLAILLPVDFRFH